MLDCVPTTSGSARQFQFHYLEEENIMNAKHLIWVLTAASLLSPSSVNVVRAQAEKHASHATVRGPLPEAVRQATERYRDVNDAVAAGSFKMAAA